MPLAVVKLRPGIDAEQTQTLNAAGWSQSQLIRWREGLPEKLGGWAHLNAQLFIGQARGCEAYADFSGTPYFVVGTDQRLELFAFGTMYDITPYDRTHSVTVSFSTTLGSATVKVTDSTHGASIGDWVLIPVPVAVGGLIIQGFYQVTTVVDANNYDITASANATANATNTGAVSEFTTINTQTNVTVTLANHGYSNGQLFGVQVQTVVGGITIAVGSYVVSSAATNTFVIVPGGTASSSTSAFENGGNVILDYLISSGSATSVSEGGYGGGDYGGGDYGGDQGATGEFSTIREWYLTHFGEVMVGNYTDGPFVAWTPPVAVVPGIPPPQQPQTTPFPASPALIVNTTNFPSATTPPVEVLSSFLSSPAQIIFALGCDASGPGTFDPCLIRWCDNADYTQWTPTVSNQAGSFRIPSGSKIVGGIQAPQFGVLWTDIDFWLIQYLGAPLVYGFDKVASGCELIASRAAGVYNSAVFWPSSENFFVFDGNSVQVIECTVWDQFFLNINKQQIEKVWCWINSVFNEIWWFYPSADTDEVDSYVKYHTVYHVWDYGTLPRTCGIDTNVYGLPIACDASGLIQQHEVGYDADGTPMMPSITSGYFSISDGSFFTFVERILPDFILNGGTTPNNRVFFSFLVQDYPTDPILTYGPFTWTTTGPPYSIIRGRGRSAALKISSQDLGVFWRLGALRYLGQAAGRR